MSPAHLGALIAAAFGLVYLVVNAGPLPAELATPVRVLGVLGFLGVLLALRRARGAGSGDGRARGGFGRAYWLVVAAEVVAILGGLAVLNGPLDAPQAGVAWVSFVVGVHFLPLARVFGEPFFRRLGAAVALAGALGLLLAAAGGSEALVAGVSGVVPGVLLLAVAWWGVHRAPPGRVAPA